MTMNVVILDDRLGGDIEVKGAELTYTHPATLNTNHDPITMSLIKNTISIFMQNFIIETLSFTNDDQLPILKTHSRTAVWKRQYHSNYRIGAKHNETRALKLRLCVRPNSPNGSGNSSTSSSRSVKGSLTNYQNQEIIFLVLETISFVHQTSGRRQGKYLLKQSNTSIILSLLRFLRCTLLF